jgi:6-phosphogluconolactonase (cycloisomerase 2 family)
LKTFILALAAMTAASHAANMFDVTLNGKTLHIKTTVPNHFYPAAGIKFNSADYQITSGCTISDNSYCLFGVSDSQAADILFSGGGGVLSFDLCLSGKGPTSCQKFTQQVATTEFLYVANIDGAAETGVTVCAIQDNGMLDCESASNSPDFDGPASISINADNTLAYVVNYPGTSISVCPINADGTFGTCIQNQSFYFSYGGSAISADGEFLFVSNYDTQTVDACPILSDGTLDVCFDTGAGGGTATTSPDGVILNKAGTIAYVANLGTSANEVAVCTVSVCTFTCSNSGGAFAEPYGLSFGLDESQVYVTNTLGSSYYSISACTVGSGGSLSCLDSGYDTLVNQPWGIVVDSAHLRAYVSNYNQDTVNVCKIDPSTGFFNGCTDSGAGPIFTGPALMSFSN